MISIRNFARQPPPKGVKRLLHFANCTRLVRGSAELFIRRHAFSPHRSGSYLHTTPLGLSRSTDAWLELASADLALERNWEAALSWKSH